MFISHIELERFFLGFLVSEFSFFQMILYAQMEIILKTFFRQKKSDLKQNESS